MSYLSDYANNVSQILLHRGDAQAQAALNRGKIWSTALSQIGETIGGIPAARQLQKDNEQKRADQAQQRQLTELEMQQAKGNLADTQATRLREADIRKNTEVAKIAAAQWKAGDPTVRAALLDGLDPTVRVDVEKRIDEFDAADLAREKVNIEQGKLGSKVVIALGGDYYNNAMIFAERMGPDSVAALQAATDNGKKPELTLPWLQKIATFGDPPPQTQVIQTVDAEGNPITKIVANTPGQEFKRERVKLSLDDQMAKAVADNNQPEIIRLRGVMKANEEATRPPEKATFEWAKLPDGSVRYMTPSEIRQQGATRSDPPKASTDAERKAHGFAVQMGQAITILDQLEDGLSESDLYQIQTLPQDKLIGWVNRSNTSEAAKRYLRAFEQFTESRLRPVSGAAIADTEYARDRRTYAKQFGETPELAADRKAARLSALQSLQSQSGSAAGNGDGAKPGTINIVMTPPPDNSGTWRHNGTTWVKK